jgi:hypothetical protein
VTEFPSKKDGWLMALLVLPLGLGLAGTIAGVVAGGRTAALIGGIAWLVLILVFVLLVFPMRYTLRDDHLEIRAGQLRFRIRYTDITQATPTRNPLSAPALSLDRLKIDYRNARGRMRWTLISPEPKADFLMALAARTGLKQDGDRLVAR